MDLLDILIEIPDGGNPSVFDIEPVLLDCLGLINRIILMFAYLDKNMI